MDNNPLDITLRPTARETFGPFTLRRYRPFSETERTILVLDDDFIGDAAIAAARARSIVGAIAGVELVLVGFDAACFGPLHQARGAYLTHREFDLSMVGMTATGQGEALEDFVTDPGHFDGGQPSAILGYSLSGVFAINLLQRHETFRHLALISPSLWLDHSLADTLSQAMESSAERRLFLAAGERETELPPGDDKTMIERIKHTAGRLEPAFAGRMECAWHAGVDHYGAITAAMDRAILSLSDRSR